ncbi:putative P-type Cu(+) transporter [Helianthus anomalus]
MAPTFKDLQLTGIGGRDSTAIDVADDDLEDVRLLDSYDDVYAEESGMKRIQVKVTGMTCAACSTSVEGALMSLNGVVSASVALLQHKADVLFDPNLVKVSVLTLIDLVFIVSSHLQN